MQKTIQRYRPVSDAPLQQPPLLARIYRHRGVQHDDELNYRLQSLPEPTQLRGMTEAVALLMAARREQWRVVVVGDFDCDGATATACALRGLRQLGIHDVSYLVPNRFTDGYGLSEGLAEQVAARGAQLLITVDTGIASLAGVARARQLGLKVLITDHHLPGQQLPDAEAIVNPNQPGCRFPDKSLAGVGVMFYLLLGLRRALREAGVFDAQSQPNLAELLDLVALGTVADVVPLSWLNRCLVAQGLARIQAGRCCAGIRALAEIGKRSVSRLSVQDFGFVLGPRLNAAGRLEDMGTGIECLLTDSPELAARYAQELDTFNRERRAIEAGMQQQALALPDVSQWQHGDALPNSLCVFEPEWHQGVIGILAGRLRERFNRPVIALACAEDGNPDSAWLKGSARSIGGLHLRDVLAALDAAHPGVIDRFGGHAMAAGLVIARDQLERFRELFEQFVSRAVTPDMLQAVVMSDGELAEAELDLRSAELLRQAGPFGQHFPEPVFDGEFTLLSQRLVGEKHLKMQLSFGQQVFDAIAFNVDLAQWPAPEVSLVHAVYQLDINEWNGVRKLQLLVRELFVRNV